MPEGEEEEEAAVKTRAGRRAWLAARGYRIVELRAAEIVSDIGAALVRIDAASG